MRRLPGAGDGERRVGAHMPFFTKLTVLGLLALSAWQVSLTASDKMALRVVWAVPQPCKKADVARRNLYFWAGASALGVVMRPVANAQKTPNPPEPRPPIGYGRKD